MLKWSASIYWVLRWYGWAAKQMDRLTDKLVKARIETIVDAGVW